MQCQLTHGWDKADVMEVLDPWTHPETARSSQTFPSDWWSRGKQSCETTDCGWNNQWGVRVVVQPSGVKKLCLLIVGVLQFLLVLPTWVVITVRFPLTRVWSRGIVDVVQRQNTASLTGTGGRYRVQTKVGWLSSSGFGHHAGFLFSYSLFFSFLF